MSVGGLLALGNARHNSNRIFLGKVNITFVRKKGSSSRIRVTKEEETQRKKRSKGKEAATKES